MEKEKYICPECGENADISLSVCPKCGYPLKIMADENSASDYEKRKKKKVIAIVFCVVAPILIILAIRQITNDSYKFYVEHYQSCMEGYQESIVESNNTYWFLSGGFKDIANTYKSMADEAMTNIWMYRIKAIVMSVVGIILAFVGVKSFREVK